MFLVLFKTYSNDHNLHSWLVVIDREARDFLLSYILFLVKLKVFLIYETGSFMKLEVLCYCCITFTILLSVEKSFCLIDIYCSINKG